MATPITSVAGVGAQTAEILVENGFDSAEALAAARQEDLVKINGFGPAKAQKFIAAAQALLGASESVKTDDSDKQDDGAVEIAEVIQDVEEQEPQEAPAAPAEKNPCTQKLCKKKKKAKKVKVTVKKKKKKASSRKKKTK